MQQSNEFILQFNNSDSYIVSDESLILLENMTNKTKMILHTQDYIRLPNEVKNKFILENIGN